METQAPGYRLRIDPDSIDARRFERLVREARPLPARERAAALREALELWRGTPLSDLAYWSFAQDAIRNLEEQRVNALQMRLEAELELGQHREAIGELDGLVREHPTHERLRWLQMLALHRSDRQAWTRSPPTRRRVWRSSRSRGSSRARSSARCSAGSCRTTRR